jgi:2'-5' RNA ligase superfamily
MSGSRAPAPLTADLETFITLVLEHVDSRISNVHRHLYPERIPERIPFSITLLYPWMPRDLVREHDLDQLRSFFAVRPPLSFDLVDVDEVPGVVAYLVPAPDAELRELMHDLWSMYAAYPPYGQPGSDPPPHATIGRLVGEHAITRQEALSAVAGLLPVHCEVHEVTLMEEEQPDRMRVRARFPLRNSRLGER